MTEAPDAVVLEQFTTNKSEEAFAELVRRHIALVHSVALRHTNNPEHAQEITQAVFIILARKAASLSSKTVLSGWLYHTARLTAANFRRAEFRRIRREQRVYMQSSPTAETTDSAWRELCPLLEDAMSRLGSTDRDALVLRFFENKSLREVGAALGLEERAAQKRVARSLEKLRTFFTKRGVVLTTAIIAGAISANSVQAAPVGLAISISAAAKGTAATLSGLPALKGALKIMAWTKAKTAIIGGIGLLVIAGTAAVTIKQVEKRKQQVERRASFNLPSSASLSARLTDSALKFLGGLEQKGELPGSDQKTMLMCRVEGPTNYPVSRSVVQKLNGGIANHYTVTKDLPDAAWQLQKAWQADRSNNVSQEFPVK